MSTLLAVDLSYQVYRASAAHKMLTSRDTFTGGLYGFLSTLAKQIRETRADRLIICRDIKPYKRSEIYPEYKQLRKKKSDDDLFRLYQESMPLVLDVIEEMGLPVMAVPGFESDDCIGHIVSKYRHRFDWIYAASNDSDLYQLFTCEWFRLLKGSELKECIDYRNLKALPFACTPAEFMLASALKGTHNDVEGIAGVGDITALKAVKDPALMRKYREQHSALIDRNLSLIKLPHPEFPRELALPRSSGSLDHRGLYRFCGRFDIEVTPSMVNSFEQVLP